MCSFVCTLLLLTCSLTVAVWAEEEHSTQFCVIGAGPGGLQLGYFLERAGRDYVIFEKNTTAGSFYLHYPRHRTLISINKRFTGGTNSEFNFRHDWNSLISDDESLLMKHYTKDYFPKADVYVKYLQDFASKLNLNIQYETEIVDVSRPNKSQVFHLTDQNNVVHHCQVVVASTGIWVPNIPEDINGIEHTVGYEDMSLDLDDYENKVVLIIGRGNAGFETADYIVGQTAYIHMMGRSRVKLAYQTHYVGDLRAVNAEQVDTYQLKSLDGQFEGNLKGRHGRIAKDSNGRLHLIHPGDEGGDEGSVEELITRNVFKNPYDIIIRCLGFKFDFSIYNSSLGLQYSYAGHKKYPRIHSNYQAVGIPNFFIAGTSSHSLDFKKSAGGFIHGFRYTVKALFNHLEWLYSGVPWPSVTLPASQLLEHLIRRINEASAPYQMFGVLGDVALIRNDGTVVYLEEVPIKAMPIFRELTGHEIQSFILWNFEYGKNYSGPGYDVLRENRVEGDPIRADRSNFLHPVLYYYSSPPPIGKKWTLGEIPAPDLYHHLVEDFLTDWTNRQDHILLLRRFIEGALNTDLRSFFAESCFEMMLNFGDNVPPYCKDQYLKGSGISASDGFVEFGPIESFEESVVSAPIL
ncbi:FAD-dependent oxidoreductase domain-containing protein 2-like [Halichondria panicea]|uniref:FAD-dependent oxidoreductase domain-containing protein 2-like n=1 Tax=Halichondria panicea TaxID=6063 RepID=UPI00312B8C24